MSPGSAEQRVMQLPQLLSTLADTKDGDVRLCFVIGSGASFSSGIPTGARLVDEWLSSLFHSECPEAPDGQLQAWAETRFGIPWDRRAEVYGRVYAARFPDNASGQSALRVILKKKTPSFGYHALAQVLSKGRHDVVITTNFDNLVEDALVAHGVRSFTARSAADAAFVLQNGDKPRILKLHGDVDRETYNADSSIEKLHRHWTVPLRAIFSEYVPLFLGYGGCDPGFMEFLRKEYPPGQRHRPVWAYRVDPLASGPAGMPPGRPSTALAEEFVTKKQAWWAPIPGFDEFMLLLAPRELGIEHSGKAISAAAEQARAAYDNSLAEASKAARQSVGAGGGSWCPQLDAFVRQAEGHLLGPAAARRWQEWNEYIGAAVTHDEAIQRAREAAEWLPEDPRAAARVALLLQQAKPADPEAAEWMQRAVEVRQGFAEDSLEALGLGEMRGRWMLRAGQWAAAASQLAASVDGHTRTLGAEHTATLTIRNNLGAALQRGGRAAEAEALFRAVLEARIRILGHEHADTLSTVHNLATALQAQGKHQEAEALLRTVLEARLRILGNRHPDTLATLHNLAAALQDQGKWSEAEALFQAVLEARKHILGDEHLDTLGTRHNLAVVLHKQGKAADAEAMLREVLEARARILDADHPDILATRHNLAAALQEQGKTDKAEALFRTVAEARIRILGPDHPDTLGTLLNHAIASHQQGKTEEAEALFRTVAEAYTRILGPDDPHTLVTWHNLAVALQDGGKTDEAVALLRTARGALTRVLGSEHPDTLTTRRALAISLGRQERFGEASDELRALREPLERVLGPDHPHAVECRRLVAALDEVDGGSSPAD